MPHLPRLERERHDAFCESVGSRKRNNCSASRSDRAKLGAFVRDALAVAHSFSRAEPGSCHGVGGQLSLRARRQASRQNAISSSGVARAGRSATNARHFAPAVVGHRDQHLEYRGCFTIVLTSSPRCSPPEMMMSFCGRAARCAVGMDDAMSEWNQPPWNASSVATGRK
jgi:hypothetical protein